VTRGGGELAAQPPHPWHSWRLGSGVPQGSWVRGQTSSHSENPSFLSKGEKCRSFIDLAPASEKGECGQALSGDLSLAQVAQSPRRVLQPLWVTVTLEARHLVAQH
jgi:hypothetical protein